MLSNAQRGSFVLVIVPVIIFLVSLGLSFGLTFVPWYSSLCTEDFFPYQTRLLIAVFYIMMASTGIGILVNKHSELARRIFGYHIFKNPLPYIGKRLSVGGLAITVVITALWAACAAIYWPAAFDYYNVKATAVNWTTILPVLCITNITAHHCDLLVGLLLMPISRNSLLGRVFKVHYSTLLFAHKFIAYCLVASVATHAIPYITFIGLYSTLTDQKIINEFDRDSPLLTVAQTKAQGIWSTAVLTLGISSLLVLIGIVVTSLARFRRSNYNTFYYFHIVGGTLFLILICFHASSNFYCLIPGLLLLIYDWIVRVVALTRPKLQATVEDAGNGWFRITTPARDESLVDEAVLDHPLQTYYLNMPEVSAIQNHAFTANKVASGIKGPEFLFRRSDGKKQKTLDKEWTWKLANQVTQQGGLHMLSLRTEGPYIPATPELFEARHVLCIAGGTGVTGAYSLANYWLANRAHETGSTFRLVWSVRERDAAQLQEIELLQKRIENVPNMSLVVQISSESGRLSAPARLQDFFGATSEKGSAQSMEEGQVSATGKSGRGWLYCSGPVGLLDATEAACLDYRSNISKSAPNQTLDWYIARWEV